MFCEETACGPGCAKDKSRNIDELVCVAVLTLDRPDVCLIFFERVDMYHPVKDHGAKRSSRRCTGLVRGDRSSQAESWMRQEERSAR